MSFDSLINKVSTGFGWLGDAINFVVDIMTWIVLFALKHWIITIILIVIGVIVYKKYKEKHP